MSTVKKLTKVFDLSKEIEFNDTSKIIIMSDCHRGDNTLSDNFAQNKDIFITALRYYYIENYTYIEIGDGDELWENKYLDQIIANHFDVFSLMALFYKQERFHMLFGNHDIVKKDMSLVHNVLENYYDKNSHKYSALFPNINISEGMILKYTETGDKIFLVHGHQGDFLNDTIWKVARFLIRYVWRPLELIGIKDPTRVATNNKKKQAVEKKLISWTENNKKILIAGHTHKTAFPNVGRDLYFNDGCCVHPGYITGIEINNGTITLIQWYIENKKSKKTYIRRKVLAGPIKLEKYFNSI